jgi:hypothetical protein
VRSGYDSPEIVGTLSAMNMNQRPSAGASPAHPWKLRIAWMALASIAAGLIFASRLPVPGAPFDQQMLGDAGDGFLNIWIVNHVRTVLADFSFARLEDGRMYWPANRLSYFWTTPLFVPGAANALLFGLGMSILSSYLWSHFLAIGLGVVACMLAFCAVADEGLPGLHPAWGAAFALVAIFSPAQGFYAFHYQNYWGLSWVLLLAVPLLVRAERPVAAAVMALVPLFLFSSSTPYYFVLGIAFLVWLTWASWREVNWLSLVWTPRVWGLTILLGIPTAYFLVSLWIAGPIGYAFWITRSLSTCLWHLLVPMGAITVEAAGQLGIKLPEVTHESPAYLGVVGVVALLAAAYTIVRRLPRQWCWLAAVLILINLPAVSVRLPKRLVWPLIAFWFALVFGGARAFLYSRSPGPDLNFGPRLALLAFVFVLGVSLGPVGNWPDRHPNPSVWGVFAAVIPGFTGMRAIGRFSVTAKMFLALWAMVAALRFIQTAKIELRTRALLKVGLVGLLALSVLEGQVNLYGGPVEERAFSFAPEEKAFLSGRLRSPTVLFPIGPEHENARVMLLFREFTEVTLVNGYSAKIGGIWEEVRAHGPVNRSAEPTEAQARILCARGVASFVQEAPLAPAVEAVGWVPVPGGRFWLGSCQVAPQSKPAKALD